MRRTRYAWTEAALEVYQQAFDSAMQVSAAHERTHIDSLVAALKKL
jgi:hypothetical protein